jgi:hypothetical protein
LGGKERGDFGCFCGISARLVICCCVYHDARACGGSRLSA